MDKAKPIAIWFTPQDRDRLEEAAALAGYRHLSKYVRDRAMGRGAGGRTQLGERVRAGSGWAGESDTGDMLADLERRQRSLQAMCVMLLFLMRSRATGGEANELIAACQQALVLDDVLGEAYPQLAAALKRLVDEG